MKSNFSNNDAGELATLEAEGRGVLIFDREGKVELLSTPANIFLKDKQWALTDGFLREVTTRNKESHLDTIRSHFLTTASHEFRTPLSTVLSSAALAENYLSEGNTLRVKAHLEKIKQAALQITDILTDFLSLSKLEMGNTKWQPAQFNLCVFCTELVEEMRTLTKPGQDIIFQHQDAECIVVLDRKLLREVVVNLILNAVKYSKKTVHLSFRHLDGMLEISIQDDGIGIPQDEQKFIFERFFRANNVMNIPGTGIGLNLTKKYLELMNGSISFESTEGKGAVFFVKIPTSSP